MKKLSFLLLPLFMVACLDPEPPQPKPQGILVTSNITENTTWYSDSIYILGGRISVVSGAELTIQPGCIIKGDAGSGASATALVIARGGKLHAVGTANAPIIFTSIVDSIQPGMIASPNLDPTVRGLWGGLIVLGNAPISATAQTIQIEGIPTSDPNGLYGGTDTLDNSGELAYISIRHGGANIGSGNEINGLTLGGVGKGTLINHIEVVANQDDGIEIFGGTVDASNLVVWGQGDDAIDLDQGYSGTINNFVTVGEENSDHALEIDGGEGSWDGYFYMWAGTLLGNDTAQCHFRDGASGFISITGDYNAEADAGTNITLDTAPNGADLTNFYWTWTSVAGKL